MCLGSNIDVPFCKAHYVDSCCPCSGIFGDAPGTLRVWAEPFTSLRLPKLFDLRADPYERADITSNTYYDWLLSQPYIILAGQVGVSKFLESFKEFPPRQRPASFSIDQITEKLHHSMEKLQTD